MKIIKHRHNVKCVMPAFSKETAGKGLRGVGLGTRAMHTLEVVAVPNLSKRIHVRCHVIYC